MLFLMTAVPRSMLKLVLRECERSARKPARAAHGKRGCGRAGCTLRSTLGVRPTLRLKRTFMRKRRQSAYIFSTPKEQRLKVKQVRKLNLNSASKITKSFKIENSSVLKIHKLSLCCIYKFILSYFLNISYKYHTLYIF